MIPLAIHGFCWWRFAVAPLKLLSHSNANFSVVVPEFFLSIYHLLRFLNAHFNAWIEKHIIISINIYRMNARYSGVFSSKWN